MKIQHDKIITVTDSNFEENTYLIIHNQNIIIIDPGLNYADIKSKIDEINLPVSMVLLTHGHYDHTFSVKNFISSKVFAHVDEKQLLNEPDKNMSSYVGSGFSVSSINFYSGTKHIIGDFEIYHTPGHTSGSVIIKIDNFIFSGDTLFFDTVGRTDLPTGDSKLLKESLKVFDGFDKKLTVYPGHGKPFILEDAYKINYFLRR